MHYSYPLPVSSDSLPYTFQTSLPNNVLSKRYKKKRSMDYLHTRWTGRNFKKTLQKFFLRPFLAVSSHFLPYPFQPSLPNNVYLRVIQTWFSSILDGHVVILKKFHRCFFLYASLTVSSHLLPYPFHSLLTQ